MPQRINPNFAQQIHTAQNLNRRPEYNYSGNSHAVIRSPRSQTQLLGKNKKRTHKTANAYQQRQRMMLAQKNMAQRKFLVGKF